MKQRMGLLSAVAVAGVAADSGMGGWAQFANVDCAKSCVSDINNVDDAIAAACPASGGKLLDCVSSSCPDIMPSSAWPSVSTAVSSACDIYSTCSASPDSTHTYTINWDPAVWAIGKAKGDDGTPTTAPAVVTITGCAAIPGMWGDDSDSGGWGWGKGGEGEGEDEDWCDDEYYHDWDDDDMPGEIKSEDNDKAEQDENVEAETKPEDYEEWTDEEKKDWDGKSYNDADKAGSKSWGKRMRRRHNGGKHSCVRKSASSTTTPAAPLPTVTSSLISVLVPTQTPDSSSDTPSSQQSDDVVIGLAPAVGATPALAMCAFLLGAGILAVGLL